MYCPFAVDRCGSFRTCHTTECMAYDKETKTCKLIDKPTIRYIDVYAEQRRAWEEQMTDEGFFI